MDNSMQSFPEPHNNYLQVPSTCNCRKRVYPTTTSSSQKKEDVRRNLKSHDDVKDGKYINRIVDAEDIVQVE
jgi:hypothetical protein